jgi:hypothetical protein
MFTANLSFNEVFNLALNDTAKYGQKLNDAHTIIAGFGGGFLLALSVYFLLEKDRKVFWIKAVEKPLQKLSGHAWLPPIIVIGIVLCMSIFVHHDTC